MNSLFSFCLPILVKYLRLIAPSAKSLMSVFVGSQDVQLEFFLDICCLAKILSLTVSAFKELVNLVLTQFTCEKNPLYTCRGMWQNSQCCHKFR